jgi:predicted helicase
MIEEFKNVKFDKEDNIIDKKKIIEDYKITESNWTLKNAIKDVQKNDTDIIPFNFRIFDYRHIPYSGTQSQGILFRPRKIQEHFVNRENIGIICERTAYKGFWIADKITNLKVYNSSVGGVNIFPLYLYNLNQKTTNFSTEIVKKIKAKVGEFEDIDLFDYVYGVLNDKEYEKKYLSYLKVDFPRIPYPKDRTEFDKFKTTGKELREIHLLQKPIKPENEISYPVSGDNIIEKLEIKDGDKLYINDKQYIKGITQEVFDYEICKYPVVKNWFSARKRANLQLDNDDLQHIKKIVNAIKLLMKIR